MPVRPSTAMPRRMPPRFTALRAATPLAALVLVATLAPVLAGAQARPRPGTIGTPPRTPPPTTGTQGGRPTGPTTPATGAARPAPPPDSLRPMPIKGIVWDSISSEPLVGATVQMAHQTDRAVSFSAVSDSNGNYRIEGVRPGRYLIGFFHPSLDALRLDPPVLLADIRPDTAAMIDLGLPGPERVRAAVCGPNVGDRAGVMLGVVRDADSNEPIKDAKVVVTWNEFVIRDNSLANEHRRIPARVRPDGSFSVCGLPTNLQVVANAEAPKRIGGLIELTFAPGELARRDFSLADSASATVVTLPDTNAAKEGRLEIPIRVARGRATMSGVVRTKDGRPLRGAKISVPGTDVVGETTDNGSFSLGGLPSGTYSVEVRAIGYTPKRVPVDLSTRRPAQLAVTIDNRVNTLANVVVQADRSKHQQDVTGFMDRAKKGGFGRYITEEDINKRAAMTATDLLRTTPGLTIVPNGSFGYTVLGRGQCVPAVYVDGMKVLDGASELDNLVRPSEIMGVEVYTGAAGTPPQFAGAGSNGCGVVAVWTKRGGPAPTSR
jgi:hypothetical protein